MYRSDSHRLPHEEKPGALPTDTEMVLPYGGAKVGNSRKKNRLLGHKGLNGYTWNPGKPGSVLRGSLTAQLNTQNSTLFRAFLRALCATVVPFVAPASSEPITTCAVV